MTYSNTLALGRRHYGPNRRHQNSVSFRREGKRVGPVTNTIILIVLACLLGLLYLTQVTKTNTYGYQINSLQQQQTQLQSQNSQLQVTSASLQAVSKVQSSQVSQSLVPVAPSATVPN